MTTIRDIARVAGVSVSTASLALNGSERVRPGTRQRVLDAAARLEYTPSHSARSLSSGRTWSLHVLNPLGNAGLSSSFFTRFVTGVHRGVHGDDYTLALTVVDDEAGAARQLDKLLRERRADGVILMNLSAGEHLLERIVGEAFPHVLLGDSPLAGVNSVDNDNEAVAADAAAHLLASGRQRILFLNAPQELHFARERARGYRRAHGQAGFAVDEELLRHGYGTAENASKCIEGMLAEGFAFDAVLTASDEIALGALRALRDAGVRVPDDVAMIGINNDDIAEYTAPRLTSVELNAVQLGLEAAGLLLASIGGAEPERRLVPHTVVQRESS